MPKKILLAGVISPNWSRNPWSAWAPSSAFARSESIMVVKLNKYIEIKDKCCISYYGPCDEYVVQLRTLRPAIEAAMPGVSVYLSCRDQALYWLSGEERVFPESQFESMKGEMAFQWNLASDLKSHPVESMMTDNDFPIIGVSPTPVEGNRHCLIITTGNHPTRSLSDAQVQAAMELARGEGFSPEFGDDNDVGWVIGVESAVLFDAARRGIRTTLIPTGLGTKLYSQLFRQEVSNIWSCCIHKS